MQLVTIINPFQRQRRQVVDLKFDNQTLHDVCSGFVGTVEERYKTSINWNKLDEHIVVSVKGRIIPQASWDKYKLKSDDQIIVMPVVAKGDTEKMILNIVLMIAIAFVAPHLAFVLPGGAAAGFATFVGIESLSLLGLAYMATIMVAGGMLVNSMSPKPKTPSASFNASELSQTFGWNPATLQQQGIPVPRFYGCNKLYGNVITTWTELTGATTNKQWLYVLFSLGIGPIKGVITSPETTVKINNQNEENFDDVAVYTNTGLVAPSIIDANFNETKTELTPNRKVTSVGGAVVYETPDANFDDLEIDLAFPAGLWNVSGGGLANYSVNVKVEIKKTTDVLYTTITSSPETITDASTSKVIRTYAPAAGVVEYGHKYNIKVTKITTDRDDLEFGDHLYLDRVREVTESAFVYPRTALVGIKALATDQLSGMIRFSCIVNCLYVRMYDDSTETWSVAFSANPAWVLFDILTQPVYSGAGTGGDPFVVNRYDGIDPSRLDLNKFTELADFCDQSATNPNVLNIAAVSNAVQAVVTTTSRHDLVIDDQVTIAGVNGSGMIEFVDGVYNVVSITDEYRFAIDYDTSDFSMYLAALLLHFNGSDAATTTVDDSPIGHTPITFVGNAQLDTAQKKWGVSSLLLDGTGDYIYLPNHKSWDVFANKEQDWTICVQFKMNTHSGSDYIMSQFVNSDNNWYLSHQHTTGWNFVLRINGMNIILMWDEGEITDNNWHHLAICKIGGASAAEYGMYVDGIQVNYRSDNSEATLDSNLYIGSAAGSGAFDGWIDEVFMENYNIYGAAPNVGKTDTITPPVAEYDEDTIFSNMAYGTAAKVIHLIEFNGGFDEGTTVWDAALMICGIARCVMVWNGTTITLAIDKAADAVQLFSMGNIIAGSFKELFLPQVERVSEIEVHYRDAAQDYKRVPFSIFNENILTVTNKMTLDAFGITNITQAERMGDFKLLQNQLLKRVCQFRVGIDALACTIGDVIYIQHDVPNWGEIGESDEKYGGGGRIIIATNDTNATITVDRELVFKPYIGVSSVVYEVMVRMEDDTIETKEITAYDAATRVITVDGVFTRHPVRDDVWLVGKQNLVNREFRIINIEIASEQEITISAIDYNEDVYAGDP